MEQACWKCVPGPNCTGRLIVEKCLGLLTIESLNVTICTWCFQVAVGSYRSLKSD